MSKTFDEIIEERKGKTLTFTTEQMLAMFQYAFHCGHETSRHTPNIAGTIKQYFIHTEEFELLSRKPEQATAVGEVIERPCQGEMNIGRTYKKVRGLAEMEAMPLGTKFYAVVPTTPRDSVRNAHAAWSDATFGSVGPVGPLKHLSKEALEAAAEPGDLSEWADMQFLLWDAQRRAGITDEQVTQAMVEKLEVNKARDWPAPKDGEPRLHIKGE